MKKVTNTTEQAHRDPRRFLEESIIFGVGHAVERQESQGQAEFVDSETLPSAGPKAVLEAAGVKFLGLVKGDPVFQYVQLPAGWKKVPIEHSMWSELLDDKGRKRAGIFYKAVFYDRSAHFDCVTRFHIGRNYDRKDAAVAVVYDGETQIHATEPIKYPQGEDRETLLIKYEMDDQAIKQASAWLAERYPDWKNAAAYWD
jgi:hypothetical protein